MTGMSNFTADEYLNDLTGFAPLLSTSRSRFMALFTAVGTDAGSGFTEVSTSGTAYARVQVAGAVAAAGTAQARGRPAGSFALAALAAGTAQAKGFLSTAIVLVARGTAAAKGRASFVLAALGVSAGGAAQGRGRASASEGPVSSGGATTRFIKNMGTFINRMGS